MRYLHLSLLVLCGAEGEPLGDALLDGTDLVILSMLSLLQLRDKSSQLFSPVVCKLDDDIQVLCVLEQDGHSYSQSLTEPPGIFTKSRLRSYRFLPIVHCYL